MTSRPTITGITAGDTISPAELVYDVLRRLGPPGITYVVGPASDSQQQRGVASLTDAGLPDLELHTPLVTVRSQIRCVGPDLPTADLIGRQIQAWVRGQEGRVVARMASTDQRYLIHRMNVSAGPSFHWDSPETFESLVFVEILVGTEPL